jgi:16S rRNA (guanine527-N7)-methyltransferase
MDIGDRVAVATARAEAVAASPDHRGRWGAVVARAVADLADLSELSLPLLRTGGLLVAWKRRPIDEELTRADRALRRLGGRVVAVETVAVPGLEDHVLVVIEKSGPTPAEYPRDPAARRRHPLWRAERPLSRPIRCARSVLAGRPHWAAGMASLAGAAC